MELREDCENIAGSGDIRWVGRRANYEKMIAEGVVAGGGGNALIKSYLLGDLTVSYSHVDCARLEIVDGNSSIACVPRHLERCRAVGNAVVDECVGKCCGGATSVACRWIAMLAE